jgi:hypothetical protein
MATMHKLVSPEGVLHLLPVDDRSILEFTKVHGIKDKKYLMNHLRGKQDESYGWQLLAKVKWLKHSSGVVIPVIGKATNYFEARAAVCERAGIDSTLMHALIIFRALRRRERHCCYQRELKCERPHNLMRSQSPETTCCTVSYSNFRDCIDNLHS